jgi:hypothetical protein
VWLAAVLWEISVVVNALILNIALMVIFDVGRAKTCADGSPCDVLITVDTLFWTLVILSTTLGIAVSFIDICAFRAVRPSDRPEWVRELWLLSMLPVICSIVALNFFVPALVTRIMLVLTMRPRLMWAATGMLAMYLAAPLLVAPYVFTRTPALRHAKINMITFWPYFPL